MNKGKRRGTQTIVSENEQMRMKNTKSYKE